MATHKDNSIEPVEHITVEDDILVIHVSGKIFDVVGKIEDLDFPEEGVEVGAGDEVISIVGSEGDIQLKSPISGIVLEVNDLFEEEIATAEEEPENYRWIVKIEPSDPEDLVKFEE